MLNYVQLLANETLESDGMTMKRRRGYQEVINRFYQGEFEDSGLNWEFEFMIARKKVDHLALPGVCL